MDKEFGLLNEDEVLFVRSGRILIPNPTFKVSEFLDALAQLVSEREEDWSDDTEGWFGEGLDCEVLKLGNQGWQRGRVRIRLEFCPEKPKLLQEGGYKRTSRNEVYTERDDAYQQNSREQVYLEPTEVYEDEIDADY